MPENKDIIPILDASFAKTIEHAKGAPDDSGVKSSLAALKEAVEDVKGKPEIYADKQPEILELQKIIFERVKKAQEVLPKLLEIEGNIRALGPEIPDKSPAVKERIDSIRVTISAVQKDVSSYDSHVQDLSDFWEFLKEVGEQNKKIQEAEGYLSTIPTEERGNKSISDKIEEILLTIEELRAKIGEPNFDTTDLLSQGIELNVLRTDYKVLKGIENANPLDVKDLPDLTDRQRQLLIGYSGTFGTGGANMISSLRSSLAIERDNGQKPEDRQGVFVQSGATEVDKPKIKAQAQDVAEYANEYGTSKDIYMALIIEHKKIVDGNDTNPTTFKWDGMDSNDGMIGVGDSIGGIDDTYTFSSIEDKKEFLESMMKLIPMMSELQTNINQIVASDPNDPSVAKLILKVMTNVSWMTRTASRCILELFPQNDIIPPDLIPDFASPLPDDADQYLATLDIADWIFLLTSIWTLIKWPTKAIIKVGVGIKTGGIINSVANLRKSAGDLKTWAEKTQIWKSYRDRMNQGPEAFVEESQMQMINKMKAFIQERAQPGYVTRKYLGFPCGPLDQTEADRICAYIDGEVARAIIKEEYDYKGSGNVQAQVKKPINDSVKRRLMYAAVSPNKGFINFFTGIAGNRSGKTIWERVYGRDVTDFVRSVPLGPIRSVPLTVADLFAWYTPTDPQTQRSLRLTLGTNTDLAWEGFSREMGIQITPPEPLIEQGQLEPHLQWLRESGIVNTDAERSLYDETVRNLDARPSILQGQLNYTLLSLAYVCRGSADHALDPDEVTIFRERFLSRQNIMRPLTPSEKTELNTLLEKYKHKTHDVFDMFHIRKLLFQPDATQLAVTDLRPEGKTKLDKILQDFHAGRLNKDTFRDAYKKWLSDNAKQVPWGYDPKKSLEKYIDEHDFEVQKEDIITKIENGIIPDAISLKTFVDRIPRNAFMTEALLDAFVQTIPPEDFVIYKMQNGTQKQRYVAYKKYKSLELGSTEDKKEYKRNKAISDACLAQLNSDFDTDMSEFERFVMDENNTVEDCSEHLRIMMEKYGPEYAAEVQSLGKNLFTGKNVEIEGCASFVVCIRYAHIAKSAPNPSDQYEAIISFEDNMGDVASLGGLFKNKISKLYGSTDTVGLRKLKKDLVENAKTQIKKLETDFATNAVSESEFKTQKDNLISRIGKKLYETAGGDTVEVNYRRARYLKLSTDWLQEVENRGRNSDSARAIQTILDSGDYEANKQGDPTLTTRVSDAHEKFLKRNPQPQTPSTPETSPNPPESFPSLEARQENARQLAQKIGDAMEGGTTAQDKFNLLQSILTDEQKVVAKRIYEGLRGKGLTSQEMLDALVQDILYAEAGDINIDAQARHTTMIGHPNLTEINLNLRRAGIRQIETTVNPNLRGGKK